LAAVVERTVLAVRLVERVALSFGAVDVVCIVLSGAGVLMSVVTLVSGVVVGCVVAAGAGSVGMGCASCERLGVEGSARAAAIAAPAVRA
jgi:hypothetical protein